MTIIEVSYDYDIYNNTPKFRDNYYYVYMDSMHLLLLFILDITHSKLQMCFRYIGSSF